MQEMNDIIDSFLNDKNITDEFVRKIVTGFIHKHTKLYGEMIPFSSLMERLTQNLDSIQMIDPDKEPAELKVQGAVGLYEGFDKNSISLFFTKDSLKSEQLREDFTSVLLHELTHCAYTIKTDHFYEQREIQVFGEYAKNDDKTKLVDGTDVFMEAIVNYISIQIYGKKNGMYLMQTKSIEKLANMTDIKQLIKSAFLSDETMFKKCFKLLPEGAFEYFKDGMSWLSGFGGYSFRKGTEIMQNFFDGNIPSLTKNQFVEDLKEIKKI